MHTIPKRGITMLRSCTASLMLLVATPALANDSIAELGTGGLILSRTDLIEMKSEDLFISRKQVRVDYVFANRSDEDVSTIVAFPMPEISGGPDAMVAVPDNASDNFLDFRVTSDGVDMRPELEQKAFAVELDVTAELKAHGIPLNPFAEDAYARLAQLPDDVARDWQERGIVMLNEYDDGSGWKTERTPLWSLRSAYWWKATFPAGKDVRVSHSYVPSVGATADSSMTVSSRANTRTTSTATASIPASRTECARRPAATRTGCPGSARTVFPMC
jgi:hypothetical protein